MEKLPIVDLKKIADELAKSGKRVRVLWQEPGSLAFVARGRRTEASSTSTLATRSPI
jgi:3-hydroxyanthranilate 3,4-dioxygenase